MATIRTSVVVSILFTVLGGPGLVLVLMPWIITRFRMPAGQSPALSILSSALIVVGLIPLFESIGRFVVVGRGTLMPAVPTERLVVSGLYRCVRNPMYVGVITALAGESLLFRSRSMLVYLGTVWLIMHAFVCLYEEPRLARTFSAEYESFRKNVPRWIPRVRPWAKGS
jgi:protein-S-isoprenylcysteine O-methyltransferase Ste14